MRKVIRVLLIDPRSETVEAVCWSIGMGESFLDLCYSWIGCSTVEVSSTDDGIDLWTNKDALFNPQDDLNFFEVDGFEGVLIGRAVITGHDGEGNPTRAPISEGDAINRILWNI